MDIKTKFKKARSTRDSAIVFRTILNNECEVDKSKEHFWVMGLDNSNSIKYIELATLGLGDRSIVDPTVVYRLAIMKGVSRIVVCHNHPSGHLIPSDADISLTKLLIQSGMILGIELCDHIIISGDGHYSFATEGILNVYKGVEERV